MTLYRRFASISYLSHVPEFRTQGDLTELLGEVPVYEPEHSSDPPLVSVPQLPADGKHPYHLVVVYFLLFSAIIRGTLT